MTNLVGLIKWLICSFFKRMRHYDRGSFLHLHSKLFKLWWIIQETYYILHVVTILYQAKRALSLTGKVRWYGPQLWKSNESSWRSRPSEVTASPLPTLLKSCQSWKGFAFALDEQSASNGKLVLSLSLNLPSVVQNLRLTSLRTNFSGLFWAS